MKGRKKTGLLIRLLAFLATAALVMGAVALVVYRDALNLDALRRYLTYRSLEKNESGQAREFQYNGDSSNSFATLDGGLLVCSTTGIQLFSQSGTLYVNETVSMEHPVITVGGAAAAVYDAGGQKLFAYVDREEAFSYTAEGDNVILSARLNENGWLTLITQKSGYKGSVTVYNAAFQQMLTEDISSSFVSDATVSPDNKTLAVVALGQNGTDFESKLRFYGLSDGLLKSEASLGSDVVLDLKWDGRGIWTLGEENVTLTDGTGQRLGRWQADQQVLKEFSLGGDGFAVLLLGRYRSGNVGELVVVDASGQQSASLSLREETRSISAAGRYISVLSAARLDIYTSNLEPYASLEETAGIRRVIQREDGSVMLIGAESARLFVPE